MDNDSDLLHIQMAHQPLHLRLCHRVSVVSPASSLRLRTIPLSNWLMVKYFSWFKARDFRRRESEIREVKLIHASKTIAYLRE
uniref:Uncharacterized protein n=1 Tax=Brassica oleracea var. oleracea TaxID=109376 RepID=A0A0D3EBF7_BRAOL